LIDRSLCVVYSLVGDKMKIGISTAAASLAFGRYIRMLLEIFIISKKLQRLSLDMSNLMVW
jgi:hypothetical protein